MASSSAPTVPEAIHSKEKPAEVVRGVPVGAYYDYQQQNRPVGYGSYSTQGSAPTYPYPSQEPTSFEVHEVRPQQPLPCLCGYQLLLFIVGWFFPIFWYAGALAPLCVRRIDPREKLGWLINSAAAVCCTILVIIVLAKVHYHWGYNYGY
ncbi:hypothetical protein COCOBI_02-5550 [Coccomyxa sp. Obi]|nr:hypothetical protein COCOBI_02-5550 [Coccomyxa sp. Obi]